MNPRQLQQMAQQMQRQMAKIQEELGTESDRDGPCSILIALTRYLKIYDILINGV